MKEIAILAYGSLIDEPGPEMGPLIEGRIQTRTPFPVEYGRISKSRGEAPTVVPHASGAPVVAKVLVLSNSVSLAEAKNLLWRRETRQEGSGKEYKERSGPNVVVVREEQEFCGVAHVLYTNFNPEGKIESPDPAELAKAAVKSVGNAPTGMDGISYLLALTKAGVVTPMTNDYRGEILALTSAANLNAALELLTSRNRGG